MPSGGIFSTVTGAGGTWPLVFLIVVSALGYSVATIGMKVATTGVSMIALGLILAGFMAATLAEIVLLRNADLGVIYIMIIGVETLVVLSFAAFIGEGLSLRGMLGASFVLGGIALVSSH